MQMQRNGTLKLIRVARLACGVPGCARRHRRNNYCDYHQWMLRKYQVDPVEYERRVIAQNGQCAICGDAPAEGKRLDIDHDHETNALRGLLCNRCNCGLGGFRDNPDYMRRAITYLAEAK